MAADMYCNQLQVVSICEPLVWQLTDLFRDSLFYYLQAYKSIYASIAFRKKVIRNVIQAW